MSQNNNYNQTGYGSSGSNWNRYNQSQSGRGRGRGRGKRRYNNKNYKNRNNKNGWNKPTKPYQKRGNNYTFGCCDDEENWKYNNNNNNKRKNNNIIYKSPFKTEFFDSHCHLDWILFKSGFTLRELGKFGAINFYNKFGGCITNSCSKDMIRPVSELINCTNITNENDKKYYYDKVYGTFGCHPHNAKEWNNSFKQQLIFALKTGKWSVDQDNDNYNYNNTKNSWMCICGYNNYIKNVFCEKCTFEPNQEFFENSQLLDVIKKLNCNDNNDNDDDDDDKKQEKEEKNIKNKNKKVVAVGECGLDYHYNKSPKDQQKKVFIEQIEISKQLNLPLVIHSREAERDTFEIMKKYCPKNKGIHLHCFTDSYKYGKQMIDEFINLKIGFTGCITFNKANKNRETVKLLPINKILLETDGPYMSPFPYRGKQSHPGYIPIIAQKIANIKNIDNVEMIIKQCRENAKQVYGV